MSDYIPYNVTINQEYYKFSKFSDDGIMNKISTHKL